MMQSSVLTRLDSHARLVTAALSSRVLPQYSTEDVLERLDTASASHRAMWMGGALGLLLALALVAAQFGVWGLGVYFAAVVLLMR